MAFSSSVRHGTTTCNLIDKFSKSFESTSYQSRRNTPILFSIHFSIRLNIHLWVISTFVINLFFIFLILLIHYINYLMAILNLFGLTKILATLFNHKTLYVHLQHCIGPISLQHWWLIQIPHKILWMPSLKREETPLLITQKPFLFHIQRFLQ